MKTVRLFVLITIFSSIIFSCNHGFLKDPRLYNPQKSQQGNMSVAEEPELQLTGGVDTFDSLEEWYNQSDAGGFPATEFENMTLVGTYFNDSNVPVYSMVAGNVWQPGDSTKSEFIHAKAPNTTGQGYEIKNVYWYSYRGKNPLYAADGTYNTQLQVTAEGNPKLSRFYFYRFTGDTLSPSLDNFLFAVDTYSKFMFAFAYPTKMESVFGNNVPKAWGPTDGSAFLGTTYQFYMYDPVGYVEKVDGKYNVVMYDWFKNNLAKGIYQPTLGGLNDKSQGAPLTPVAEKKPDGQGTSPFNNHKVNFFEENMKLLADKTFMYREKTANGGNSLNKVIYTISADGTKLTKKTEVWNGLEETPSDIEYTITKDEQKGSATEGIVSGGDGKITLLKVEDEGRTLVLNDGEYRGTTTFQDYGPDFIERVKHNPVYKNGNISYTFSEGGKKLVYVSADNETYNYEFIQQWSDTERYKGVYWTDDAVASWMGIGYGGVALYDSDFQIKVTNTSAGGAGIVDWLIMKDEAFLEQEAKTTFIDNVKNRSFSLREKNKDGFDVNLLTYSFDSNGNATFTRTPWQKRGSSETYSVSGTDQNSGLINNEQARLDTTGTNWTLSIGGKVYTQGYIDNGPSFLNRVKGAIYNRGNTRYEFSSDGRTLSLSYEKLVWESWLPSYKVVTNSYIYDEGSEKDNVIATYDGYRVHLTQNDSVINMATLANVGNASVMEYGADRQN